MASTPSSGLVYRDAQDRARRKSIVRNGNLDIDQVSTADPVARVE